MATTSHGGGFDWPHDLVRVAPGEQTCLVCGEIAPASQRFCVRCSDPEKGIIVEHWIPTVSYLRDEDYVFV